MKLAWLVWVHDEKDDPEFWTSEPDNWYPKVVPIVYSEIVQ